GTTKRSILPRCRMSRRGPPPIRAAGEPPTGVAPRAWAFLQATDGLRCRRRVDVPSRRRPYLRLDPRKALGNLPPAISASEDCAPHHRRPREGALPPTVSPSVPSGGRLLRPERVRTSGRDTEGANRLRAGLEEPGLPRATADLRSGSGECRLSNLRRHRRENGSSPRPRLLRLQIR